MQIINLTKDSPVYTANAWYVTGTWKGLDDVNTLVDAGMDPAIVARIAEVPCGLGKRRLDRIILTHSHSDHAGQAEALKAAYHAEVLAWSTHHRCVDRSLHDGEQLRIGDALFETIHMPGHSQDSILLYSREEGVLFAGDSPLLIRSADGWYEPAFVRVLERLARLPVERIYFGHGEPLAERCGEMLRHSLDMAHSHPDRSTRHGCSGQHEQGGRT